MSVFLPGTYKELMAVPNGAMRSLVELYGAADHDHDKGYPPHLFCFRGLSRAPVAHNGIASVEKLCVCGGGGGENAINY